MTDNVEQALYWPEDMLREITAQATRTDRSLSYIAQFAFKTARERLESMEADAVRALPRGIGGDKRKQTLYFPADMLAAMQAIATRIDSSLSTIAQAAVVLAREEIAALPVN